MAKLHAADALIGARVELEHPVRVFAFAGIQNGAKIGRYSYINRGSFIAGSVSMGRYCSVSRGCDIGSSDHPLEFLSTHPFQYNARHFESVEGYDAHERVEHNGGGRTGIGHDVLVGAHSIVLRGVTIGDGAVIGAGSFVKDHVPPYAIVVGSPARVIRYRFDEATIERLQQVQWWDLQPAELDGVQFDDVDRAIDQIAALKSPLAQPV